MTAAEQQEFIRLTNENEDFKHAVKLLAKLIFILSDKLEIDFNQFSNSNFDLSTILEIVPNLMFKFQSGDLDFEELGDELQEFKELPKLFEKYKYLIEE